ncbi:unnamed protein product (macronuclear) [Paramecium tetraurelia]|uniref:Uncharacterized protein n=1 Tax=Paramecium tetraurelia TaxID=5888 RepID=A0CIW0_PARTE|nr:uncharacterized protein GSPATT00007862001 [Paramecium tetraurelia]CAK70727.1 unnamed protein product [Paramecium tetraurelia]|eukprot:XP_001438124.1 hypothetical protein (macronuclear) [Paramecium tetraurelia strain d4-2]
MQKYSTRQPLIPSYQKASRSQYEYDNDKIIQIQIDANLRQDLSPTLSIIKTHNISLLAQNAIRELEDNTYHLLKEQYSKQSIMIFNGFHQNSLNSCLCLAIKQLVQNTPYFQLQQIISDLLRLLEEVQKLQQNQQITNVLVIQCFQKDFQNEIFQATQLYSLYSQQILNRNDNYLFINFSGLNTIEQDIKMMKELSLLKKRNMEMYYLSFHKREFQKKQKKHFNSTESFEQYFLESQQNHPITWPQLKAYLKPILKRKIKLFNPKVCVLQLFVSLNNLEDEEGLIFENDCILKIVHFFKKFSQDKLIINLLIKDQDSSAPVSVSESIEINSINHQDEKNSQLARKKLCLKQVINAIEQGVFGHMDVDIVDKRSYDQTLIEFKCQLNQLKNQEYQQVVQRSLNNLICQQANQIRNSSEPENLGFHYIPFIDNNRSLLFFEFYYNNDKILVNNSTQVYLKQKEKIVIIFQVQEFKLYYCKIQCKCVKKDCNFLNLQEYLNFDQIKNNEFIKAPIIAVIEDKIFLNYGYLGDQILEFSIIDQKVIFKNRMKLSNFPKLLDVEEQQKQYILEREGASVFYNLLENKEENHYFIAGGELGQNSPVCNIIERVVPEKEGFSSGFVSKSLFKVSLKPFQHSLILEDNQSVIFLPGDFNKKRFKYSQIINHQHYQQAQRLSLVRNNWVLENIKIVYENEELGRLYPIHLMPKNQQIVYNVENDHWIACFFGLQIQSVGSTKLSSQQIYIDEINQFHYESSNSGNEGNLSNVIIKMEFKFDQNQLITSITPFQFRKNRTIIENTVQLKTEQNAL